MIVFIASHLLAPIMTTVILAAKEVSFLIHCNLSMLLCLYCIIGNVCMYVCVWALVHAFVACMRKILCWFRGFQISNVFGRFHHLPRKYNNSNSFFRNLKQINITNCTSRLEPVKWHKPIQLVKTTSFLPLSSYLTWL